MFEPLTTYRKSGRLLILRVIAIFRQLRPARLEFHRCTVQRRDTATLNRPPKNEGNGCIAVLHHLADSLKGQVKKKKTMLYGGTTLTRQLRGLYRGHEVELLANDELICADIEASYGQFELLMVNPRPASLRRGTGVAITTKRAKYTIFPVDGNLSAAQADLCESGALGRLLDVVDPREGEEVNVSQRLVRVYLQQPNIGRVTTIIDAVIDIMPHEPRAGDAFDNLPEALRPLAPLLVKWAIDDDNERTGKLRRCTRSSLQRLVDTVVPLLPAIDNFLDSFGMNPSEEACALGSLAQAALEAQSLLGQRAKADV